MEDFRKKQQMMDLLNFSFEPEAEQFNMTAPENLMMPETPTLPPPVKKQASRAPSVESAPSPETSAINPVIREHLRAKYGLIDPESYDAEMLKKQEEAKERKSGLGLAQFAAGMGDALAGRSPSESAKTFQGYRDNIDKETVGNLESRRKSQMENLSGNNMLDKMQRENDTTDPTSPQSIAFRKIIESKFPEVARAYGKDWANVSAADQELIFKPLQLKEQIEGRNQQARILSMDRQAAREERAQAKAVKDKELSVAQAKQLGLYKSGALADEQYEEAVKDPSSYDPTSYMDFIDNASWAPNILRNDNAIKADAAKRAWVESYLRDASGAAIPQSERLDYAKDYFPEKGDPQDVVENKKKLRQQKEENARIGSGGHVAPKRESKPETKVINGKTYKRVPGGWEEVG